LAQRRHFNLDAIVLNRMLDERTFVALQRARRRPPAHLTEIARLRREVSENDPKLGALIRYLEKYREHQRLEVEQAVRFAYELQRHLPLFIIPAVEPGVRDLRSLSAMSSMLTNSLPGRQFLNNAAGALDIAATLEPVRRFT
jgi:hypothetical protein